MRKKLGMSVLIAAIVVSALTFKHSAMSFQQGDSSHPSSNSVTGNSVAGASVSIPEHIPYRIFFHNVYVLNREAEKAEKDNKHIAARTYRTYIEQTGLREGQAQKLIQIASTCEDKVNAIDQKAKVIIDHRKAYYKDGIVAIGQQYLPPSEELQALQQQRNKAILECRDELLKAMGEKDFDLVHHFIQGKVVPKITVSTNVKVK